jgi:hypothetical protein
VAANEAEAGFVELVRRAAAEVDFRDATAFDPWLRELYRAIARRGWWYAWFHLDSTVRAAGPYGNLVRQHFAMTLDDCLYARILRADGLRYLPMHELQTVPQNGRVLVNLRSLRRAKGAGGTVYYSSHRPKVRLGERDRVVAFSGHALVQAADRATYHWRRAVGGLTDAFALFEYCLQFEPWTQPDGDPGFVLWENCHGDHFSGYLARSVLGGAYSPGKEYRYRVGYCPAVVEGEFLKAKTLLFPGFRGTPEHKLLLRSPLPRAEKQSLREVAHGLDTLALREGKGLGLIRWFHEHGAPQIAEGRVRFALQPMQALAPSGGRIVLTPREAERIEEFGRRNAQGAVRAAIARGNVRRRHLRGNEADTASAGRT